MATDVTQTVAAQIEQVRPIMQEIYEESDQVSSLFKKNAKNIENVTRYLYRIPLLQYIGGTHKKYAAGSDAGSLGRGTGMKITSLQAGYFYSITMFRVVDEQVDLSQNTKESVVNVMSKTLASGMMQEAIWDDQTLHTDGTGELTFPCDTITGTNTMTFNGLNDTIGASKLRAGNTVDVWTYDGATKRAAGTAAPIVITSVDYSTNTVVFDQNVTSLSAGNGVGGPTGTGDMIAVYDLDSYGPSTLVSFQSGWPATSALTTAGGLTNDSFRHGIYYAHDFNTSNYYLGKQKSALPEISPNKIDASTQSLNFVHGWALQDIIRKRRSNDEASNLIGIFPMGQRRVVWELGTSISTKLIQGDSFGKSIDLSPTNNKYDDTFNYCNMTCYVSKRQFYDRADFFNLKNWGRAEVFPLRPYEKNGNTVFEGRNSSGLLAPYSEFGFQSAYDFVCYDPGAEGAITNLKIPANA